SPRWKIRPESGFRWPVTRLKIDDLPAPLGPRIPTTSPSVMVKASLSATRTRPKALSTASRRSSSPSMTGSGDRLQLVGDRHHGSLRVVDHDQLVLALAAAGILAPLAAGQRRLRDVLHRTLAPFDLADDRVEV